MINYSGFASLDETKRQIEEETATPPKKTSRKEDPRFWRPRITETVPKYQAMVRILPRDPHGKLGYHVRQDMHYFIENGASLVTKCRKTLGKSEKCPLCDANWKMWNTKDPILQAKAKKRANQTTYIGNVLILNDLNQPELNGQVKLWEHRDWMHNFILGPITKGVSLRETPFGQEPVLDYFNPFDPINGRNLIVYVVNNPENNIPTYQNSMWDKQSPLAPFTNDQNTFDYVMSQINDLNEFINDVPSIDDLTNLLVEFQDKISGLVPSNGQMAIGNGFVPGYTVPSMNGMPNAMPNAMPSAMPSATMVIGGQTSSTGVMPNPFTLPNATQPSVATHNASVKVPVPGLNTNAFQIPPVTEGNSVAYFAPQTPVATETPATPTKLAEDVQTPDDLPF